MSPIQGPQEAGSLQLNGGANTESTITTANQVSLPVGSVISKVSVFQSSLTTPFAHGEVYCIVFLLKPVAGGGTTVVNILWQGYVCGIVKGLAGSGPNPTPPSLPNILVGGSGWFVSASAWFGSDRSSSDIVTVIPEIDTKPVGDTFFYIEQVGAGLGHLRTVATNNPGIGVQHTPISVPASVFWKIRSYLEIVTAWAAALNSIRIVETLQSKVLAHSGPFTPAAAVGAIYAIGIPIAPSFDTAENSIIVAVNSDVVLRPTDSIQITLQTIAAVDLAAGTLFVEEWAGPLGYL